MKEIEVKILEVNVPLVIKKLKKMGAKKTFEGKMIATMYDFPDERLKKKKSGLRLRSKGDYFELTFKKSVQSKKAKVAEEHQLLLKDGKTMQKILQELGLKEIRTVTKKRISYSLGNGVFDIDHYPGIPAFLEIEAPTVKILQKWVQKMGFSLSEMRPWSGKQVFDYYAQKRQE